MMKILHSADWHLGSSLPELRHHLLSIPGKIAELALRERCDLMLLSGDLFDGPCNRESLEAVRSALAQVKMPVFIAPGNHDFCGPGSPWLAEVWPENVHIFVGAAITSVALPALSCRVYGSGFQSMDCPPLLAGFHADCAEKYAIGVFHGDPTQLHSPYNPVTAQQVRESGLDYLALGHIHKQGSFRTGSALCAWPGCPMGRGFDETGEKGVLIVTLEDGAQARFVPLGLPQFHDLVLEAGTDPAAMLQNVLPPVYQEDHYRVTFTGESGGIDTAALGATFPHIPHLQLRDRTQPPVDLWAGAGEDTLEGIYFALLRQQGKQGELAAKISRRILNGQEVELL